MNVYQKHAGRDVLIVPIIYQFDLIYIDFVANIFLMYPDALLLLGLELID